MNKKLTLLRHVFLTSLVLHAFSAFASGGDRYQKLSIDIKDATLVQVFAELADRSPYTFTYGEYILNHTGKYDAVYKKKPLAFMLKDLGSKADFDYLLENFHVVIKKKATTAKSPHVITRKKAKIANRKAEVPLSSVSLFTEMLSISISGQVTDENGEGLPGTSVLERGTTNGTITDVDGNYRLTVSEGATLQFSFVGYLPQEVVVGGQSVINVEMQADVQQLGEVVVIGYGTQKKSDVTGAISTVKGEDLTRVVTPNPTEALQGRVAGVTVTQSSGSPGANVDVVIRGIGSFGSNQPLYIVDGVQADPYFLDPNNIASIEVLKDVAASAIYGTRAANGVVLITTKQGKAGKPTVDFTSSVSLNSVRKEMELLDADGYAEVHRAMYQNAGQELPQYVQNPPGTNTDWIDETHRQGMLQLYNLRVSGASDIIDYSISGNLADEKGILIGSRFNKKGVNARVGLNHNRLEVNTSLNYNETYTEGHKFSVRETYFISPLIPVRDDSKESGFGYRDGGLPDHRNPVGEDAFIDDFREQKYFLGNIDFGYEIIEGLRATASFAISNLNTYGFRFHPKYKVRAVESNSKTEFPFVSETNKEFRRINQQYNLSYNFEAGKHSFDLLAGYQRINEPFRETNAQAEGYKEDADGKRVPAVILSPSFSTLNAFTDGTYSASGANSAYSLVSQFGRINYAYDDKYLFQASIRRDGSSKFGTNNRYGVFPSFALGWKITDESFMANQRIFDFLKLRYSWGQAGSDAALGVYEHTVNISRGRSRSDGGYVFGDPQASSVGSIVRDLQNNDLQWETNTASNIGIDFVSLGFQLNGSINYYQSRTEDLLITREVPSSAGVNNPTSNVGEFVNKGFELELGYKNSSKNFNYSAFATFTTINSEVTKLSNAEQQLFGIGLLFGSDHFVNQTRVGHEPGAYFLQQADGIFQNQAEIDAHAVDGNPIQPNAAPGDIRFVDQNGDGLLNADDVAYQGTAIPKFEYGLNLSVEHKGFDVNIFLQGVGGNKIYNGNDFRLMSMEAGRNYRVETRNAWTPENPDTDIPRAVSGDPNRNNRASTRFLENGAYLRVKTLQLGYSVPFSLLEKVKINRLRLYVTGQNLFTITGYGGLDPEVGGSVLSRGIDRNLYPKYKSVIFGLQLQF